VIVEIKEQMVVEETEPNTEHVITLARALAAKVISEDDIRISVMSFFEDIIERNTVIQLGDLFLALAVDHREDEPDLEKGKVNIMTMHQAKGLTTDVVLIVAAEDEIFPQSEVARSVDDDRRLLYVSMTRARHKLYISYAARRTGSQLHTGRNSGIGSRHLTRFLRDGELRPEPGADFVKAVLEAKS
jgi:DNA helicase-2/ATP-dependent DNA helicase PcrA